MFALSLLSPSSVAAATPNRGAGGVPVGAGAYAVIKLVPAFGAIAAPLTTFVVTATPPISAALGAVCRVTKPAVPPTVATH